MSEEPLDERRALVLRAVVEGYIRTGEPVGSRVLAERYGLKVSPATIRNDMAALESLGYLTHPHTSAGRIPTDTGYRFYVDTLPKLPRLSESQRQAIVGAIDERISDVEELMRSTAHVLSRVTPYAAVALPPALPAQGIARVDLVPVPAGALLLVVSDAGRVDRPTLDVQAPAEVIERVGALLAQNLAGLTHAQARVRTEAMASEALAPEREILETVAGAFGRLDAEPGGEHVFIGGVANIAGEEGFERRESLQKVFEALDEEGVILRFLQLLARQGEHLAVKIGSENPLPAMQEASVVLATYEVAGRPVGTIAVIGPTRMAYPSAMSTVDAVSRRLSAVIEALGA